MTAKPTTMAERLARIETILDEKVVPALDSLVTKVDADVADLARLKNRGAGVLVGVSIAFTTLGALLRPIFDSVKGLFH
jgi:hypothetical protein